MDRKRSGARTPLHTYNLPSSAPHRGRAASGIVSTGAREESGLVLCDAAISHTPGCRRCRQHSHRQHQNHTAVSGRSASCTVAMHRHWLSREGGRMYGAGWQASGVRASGGRTRGEVTTESLRSASAPACHTSRRPAVLAAPVAPAQWRLSRMCSLQPGRCPQRLPALHQQSRQCCAQLHRVSQPAQCCPPVAAELSPCRLQSAVRSAAQRNCPSSAAGCSSSGAQTTSAADSTPSCGIAHKLAHE
jgi:hypothetical protein